MSKEEMNKYAYELMIKNNPDEVIKNLMLLEQLQQRIEKAIEYFTRRDIEWGSYEQKVLLDILRGESNE